MGQAHNPCGGSSIVKDSPDNAFQEDLVDEQVKEEFVDAVTLKEGAAANDANARPDPRSLDYKVHRTVDFPDTTHNADDIVLQLELEKEAERMRIEEAHEEERRREEMIIRKQIEKEEFDANLVASRAWMLEDPDFISHEKANRYGNDAGFPAFQAGVHIPTLALINSRSGAMAGKDILDIARRTPYYQDRFFNIIDVMKSEKQRGGLLDVFRAELNLAKDEAKAMGTRPRLISGGGDGTGSFAIFMMFLALKADDDRADEGLKDAGNGFIWTDEEMAESYPALAQMPLGSANDFGNILGWGQKYPGDRVGSCESHDSAARKLASWIESVVSPTTRVSNFDVWGIMPCRGQDECNFKIAELAGHRGRCPNQKVDGDRHLHLKEAGKPVPFFICLYFSSGFGAYVTARFQLNRRNTPIKNRLEYARQGFGIAWESTPPQMNLRLNGLEIDCEDEAYFPPRRDVGNLGRGYREVGFYNINWQAHLFHGADRAPATDRLVSSRDPVKFNDGLMDMYRWKFLSLLKNPGFRVQTDKRKEMVLNYSGDKGKGVFFQWDGEARFAFSKTGQPFQIHVRRVLSIPVLLGPFLDASLTGDLDNGRKVQFEFSGDTTADRESVRRRVLQFVAGELDSELNASRADILQAGMRHQEAPG